MNAIYRNDDVILQWKQLASHIDENSSAYLLQKITSLYLTIRGHAFAKSCIELYKQHNCKRLQKSKGLRQKPQLGGD